MDANEMITALDDSTMQIAAEADLQLRFRDAMAQVAGPVTVITAADGARAHGTTVSAFMSLSMSPPMVLVSLNLNSALLDLVTETRTFGVNVLAAHQGAIALAFARKEGDKFAGIDWRLEDGLPRIEAAAAWLACDVDDIRPGGDHMIVTGAVRNVVSEESAPLTYHNRIFGTHTPVTAR